MTKKKTFIALSLAVTSIMKGEEGEYRVSVENMDIRPIRSSEVSYKIKNNGEDKDFSMTFKIDTRGEMHLVGYSDSILLAQQYVRDDKGAWEKSSSYNSKKSVRAIAIPEIVEDADRFFETAIADFEEKKYIIGEEVSFHKLYDKSAGFRKVRLNRENLENCRFYESAKKLKIVYDMTAALVDSALDNKDDEALIKLSATLKETLEKINKKEAKRD